MAQVQAVQFRGSSSGEIIRVTSTLPDIQPNEVLVRVTHSGLCGSDIHQLQKPLVLGHEGVGIVEEVGPACSAFVVGDRVGWGPVSSTCNSCNTCLSGRDAYCAEARNYSMTDFDTLGSLCSYAIRNEQWLFHVPDALSSEDAAPLMCGGGTVWTPLVEHCKPYDRVGVVAVGGLGHLAIQFAAKMGCEVVAFSSTSDKREEALRLGASEFYATGGLNDYTGLGVSGHINCLLITASAKHDLSLYYPLLAKNATIVPLSVDGGDLSVPYISTLLNGYQIVGSLVCSRFLQIKMLEFAARHGIQSVVERFPMTLEGVQEAVDRLRAGKMRYRGVLAWSS